MANAHISQREARRMRAELARMKGEQTARINRWNAGYPGGVNIETLTLPDVSVARLDVAGRLAYALVVKLDGNTARFYAVKP